MKYKKKVMIVKRRLKKHEINKTEEFGNRSDTTHEIISKKYAKTQRRYSFEGLRKKNRDPNKSRSRSQ